MDFWLVLALLVVEFFLLSFLWYLGIYRVLYTYFRAPGYNRPTIGVKNAEIRSRKFQTMGTRFLSTALLIALFAFISMAPILVTSSRYED